THKLADIGDLIRLSRPYGTLLLLFPALWSLFIAAGGHPPWALIALFAAGAFLMRSAGCAINDVADHRFDRNVRRTCQRPIASGRLTRPEGIAVFILLSAVAGTLALLLPPLAIYLAVAGFLLAILYPFTKRFFFLPQLILGITFGWGTLLGWATIQNEITLPGLLIFGATVFWATAYDTIYAIMDQEDDSAVGVKSSALFFGTSTWMAVGAFYTLGLLCLAFLIGFTELGAFFGVSLTIVAAWFGYHVWRLKIGIS
ncbi:MAG: 4-hydroxybenzoate octaprenyltransferase, partial [Deltaproteobacteria bacterium]|nr:4-hydroxybenzoate octaprenyltransferase [Deltaproteobacteria bacterium]